MSSNMNSLLHFSSVFKHTNFGKRFLTLSVFLDMALNQTIHIKVQTDVMPFSVELFGASK